MFFILSLQNWCETDLASLIAEGYPFLIKERDQSSMTAFQYLACNPTTFRKRKIQRRGFIEQLNKSKTRMKQSSMLQEFVKFSMEILTELCMVHLTLSSSSFILHLLNYSYLHFYLEGKFLLKLGIWLI